MIRSSTFFMASMLLIASHGAFAAPTVTRFEGAVSHASKAFVEGQGFGSKAEARPKVWEDCTSGALSPNWSGAWPNRSANKTYDTACRSPMNGVELPHSNVTKYVAGAHAEEGGYDAGANVMLFKARTISSYPAYTYASWYQRVDQGWGFCGDNNFKTYDFSTGTSPYDPENWYIEYNPRPTSLTSRPAYHLNDNGNALQEPDANGNGWWWNEADNPMGGKWTKVEVEIRYAKDSSGYIRLWENGNLRVNYRGRTDNYAGSQRNDGIGGYARCVGSKNWRYFSDVYLDHSRARVILTDNADYTKATIFEPQLADSWSSGRVDFTVNLGRLANVSQVYAFVYSDGGERNSVGFKLGGSGVSEPMPPTNINVQ